jgi:hypothetical protein
MKLTYPKTDDFIVLNRSTCDVHGLPLPMFAVVGPSLGGAGLQFRNRVEAELKGLELAQANKVSLLYNPNPHRDRFELVATYREGELHPQNRRLGATDRRRWGRPNCVPRRAALYPL